VLSAVGTFESHGGRKLVARVVLAAGSLGDRTKSGSPVRSPVLLIVDGQEGPSTTGPKSALIVVQWSKVPTGSQQGGRLRSV